MKNRRQQAGTTQAGTTQALAHQEPPSPLPANPAALRPSNTHSCYRKVQGRPALEVPVPAARSCLQTCCSVNSSPQAVGLRDGLQPSMQLF